MRVVGLVGIVGSLAAFPGVAAAGHHAHDDAPVVRDHRSHDDAPVVRDHRHDDAPIVRDHRHDDAPVVRDHRHDNASSGDHYDSATFTSATSEEVYLDPGPSEPFANVQGPTWSFELGGFAHRFRGPSFSRGGTVETTDGDMATYGLDSANPTAGDTAAGAFELRFTVPASEHLYAGAELGIGGLTRSPVQLMTDSDIHIASRSMVDSDAVIGVRARRGIAELDGEVAGGLRVTSLTVQSLDAGEDDPSNNETALSPILEARLRGVLWVAPHVFVAASAGTGMIDHSDVNVGFSVGISSRPFARLR
jgi:hypothetical protein